MYDLTTEHVAPIIKYLNFNLNRVLLRQKTVVRFNVFVMFVFVSSIVSAVSADKNELNINNEH